jgi:hypothetical protein
MYIYHFVSATNDTPIEKMGAPPKRRSSHGRANPAGSPISICGRFPTPLRPRLGPLPARLLALRISPFLTSGP